MKTKDIIGLGLFAIGAGIIIAATNSILDDKTSILDEPIDDGKEEVPNVIDNIKED